MWVDKRRETKDPKIRRPMRFLYYSLLLNSERQLSIGRLKRELLENLPILVAILKKGRDLRLYLTNT